MVIYQRKLLITQREFSRPNFTAGNGHWVFPYFFYCAYYHSSSITYGDFWPFFSHMVLGAQPSPVPHAPTAT
jgi:hypothetical protein